MNLSRWEVTNAPSCNRCASCTSQGVSTRLPQVSPLQKAPRLPGFSMKEKETPAPASKPKSERALKGWKRWHNMKKMLFAWNFTREIHMGQPLQLHINTNSGHPTNHGCTQAKFHQRLTSNLKTKQATRNARSQQQPDFLQPFIPKSHMLFSLSATTPWLSEKCKIPSCLLRNIKENRGNWLQFSSYKLITSNTLSGG